MSNLAEITKQIESEIKVDANGVGRASIRATARLADVSDNALRKSFLSANLEPSNLAKHLTNKGFEGANLIRWSDDGIPDLAIAGILEYYAFYAGRYCTEQSRLVLAAFSGIGIRVWLQQLAGYEKPSTQQDTKQTYDFNSKINFLLDCDKQLTTAKNSIIRNLIEDQIKQEASKYGIQIEFPKSLTYLSLTSTTTHNKSFKLSELVVDILKGIDKFCARDSYTCEFSISDIGKFNFRVNKLRKSEVINDVIDVLIKNEIIQFSRNNVQQNPMYRLCEPSKSYLSSRSKSVISKIKESERNAKEI